MPAQTPVLALPYPLGTDKVQQGDNDIRALAERLEARLPRGVIDVKTLTSAQAVGNPVQVTGLAITANLYAGRWYRATFAGNSLMVSGLGITVHSVHLDGATIKDWNQNVGANAWQGYAVDVVFQTTTGSHTVTAWASTQAGSTIQVTGAPTNPCLLTLTDAGPVSLVGLLDARRESEPDVDNELPKSPPDRTDNELPETAAPKEDDR